MAYAEGTDVPVSRSKAQLEAMLKAAGAEGFASSWDQHGDRIEFLWRQLRIRFHLPKGDGGQYLHDRAGRVRKPDVVARMIEQKDRQRWRALYLVVRAKIEAVEAGIAVFEEEFLAFIVDEKTDKTVGAMLLPRLDGGARGLLSAGKGGG